MKIILVDIGSGSNFLKTWPWVMISFSTVVLVSDR